MADFQTARALSRLVDPKGRRTVVDGGFFQGGFTKSIQAAWPNARVLAFEPDPKSFANAARNFAENRNITLFNAALGERSAKAEFFRGEQPATNSLLPRPDSADQPYFPAKATLKGGTTVDVVALDDVLDKAGIDHVHLLKLDLQGAELAAMRGAKRLLAQGRADVIQCEVVFVAKYRDQPLFWEICAHVAQYGYRLHSFVDVVTGPYDAATGPRKKQWNQADAIFLSAKVQALMDA